jgi:hypothetical protein
MSGYGVRPPQSIAPARPRRAAISTDVGRAGILAVPHGMERVFR